jgi:cardiolipin synthase A/B
LPKQTHPKTAFSGPKTEKIDPPATNRGRALRIVHQKDLGTDVIRLVASDLHATEDMGDVFAALEGEDEVIVGVRPSPDKLVRRFAVVSVRDSQKVDGLPSHAWDAAFKGG